MNNLQISLFEDDKNSSKEDTDCFQKDDRVIDVQPENKLLDVFDLTKLVR